MSLMLVATVLASTPFELSKAFEEEPLVALVWRDCPDLQSERIKVARLEADRRKALRLPNPGLDVSVNTLPVGPLNPPGLKDPYLNVPNVAVGLSVLVELGKRGPRQDAAEAAAQAGALEALDALNKKVLDLKATIGEVAAAQLRVETFSALADDGRRLLTLQETRAQKGDTAALDADKARLELEATLTLLGEAQEQLAVALRQCADTLAAPCSPFTQVQEASAWLEQRFVARDRAPDERPDLRALDASARSARASQLLAERGWLPDLTVRLGYVRDQFVISGNQQNSFFAGISLPLPLFERGVDDAQAAAQAALSAQTARSQRLATAEAQLARLKEEMERVEKRHQRIEEFSLPLARHIVERLGEAVARGVTPLQELLFARRSLSELLLSAAELSRIAFQQQVELARLTSAPKTLPEHQP